MNGHAAMPAMQGTDSYTLVALSIVVAMGASYMALTMAARIKSASWLSRLGWLIGSATALQLGIWGMHFVSVPLFTVPIRVNLDPWMLALSAVAALGGATMAAYFMSKSALRPPMLALSALGLGLALICMHRVGMMAMAVSGEYTYHPRLPGAAFGMVLISGIAVVWLTNRMRQSVATGRRTSLKSATAVIMGVAIAGAHYAEMAASPFSGGPGSVTPSLDMAALTAVLGGSVLVSVVIGLWSMYINHRLTVGAELSRLAAIVASSNDAIISANRAGLVRTWNAGAERLYGYSATEMIGKPVAMLVPNEHVEEQQDLIERVVAGEHIRNVEMNRLHKNGTPVVVALTLSPIHDETGRTIGISSITRDITERHVAELAMRNATAAAEAANRAKSEFLANMSHEIRTPMNGVLGMLDLALDTELRPEQRDYLATAKSSADSLLTLINDILDFSKIEAGKMSLEPRPFAVRAFLTDLMRPLELRASQKGLKLSVDIDPSLPEEVVGDSHRIRQILINLLGNAIKFTNEGEVTIRVGADTAAGPSMPGVPLHVHFVIRDTGIGISSDKQRAIFEAFVQADASTTREHGGTGLGLAIAAKLVSLMGGHIRVESELGEGSTFYLTLLLRAADDLIGSATAGESVTQTTSRVPLVAHPRTPPLRILLADDNAVNQKFLGALLMKRQHMVVVASNGREVLETIAKAEFDLILMDVHMPELGGFETTALIRAMEEGTSRHMPIIAVTARAMVGDRERCLEAGMDDYLSKPIHLGSLYDALDRWAPATKSVDVPKACTAPPPVDRGTLLSRVDGDELLLAELVAIFAEESPRLLSQMHAALAAQDNVALKDSAHALKGSASSMAVDAVTAAAGALERMADAGTLDEAPHALIELEEILQRSIGALNDMTGTGSP